MFWKMVQAWLPAYELDFDSLKPDDLYTPKSGKVIQATNIKTRELVYIRFIPLPEGAMERQCIERLVTMYDEDDCPIVVPIDEMREFQGTFDGQLATGVCFIMHALKRHWLDDLLRGQQAPRSSVTANDVLRTTTRVLQIGRRLEMASVVHGDIVAQNILGEGEGLVLIDLDNGQCGPDVTSQDHRRDAYGLGNFLKSCFTAANQLPVVTHHFPVLLEIIQQMTAEENMRMRASAAWTLWEDTLPVYTPLPLDDWETTCVQVPYPIFT
ncbi:hypothetical protein CALVIDRAFT_569376 [Calocera viscosa TUFC12733]|uniref:Protein kinase domain-containing protein n=1 Tax=Calocera viscosa (strain TUFC12733) TaxID=1330018 RepID=A0A167G0V3_CALVF|nr:hypothetical protein CALVIDRAFT_569376 [Calocera viscosa TUFC12733]